MVFVYVFRELISLPFPIIFKNSYSYELKMEKVGNDHQKELKVYDQKIDSINNINDSLLLTQSYLNNKVINITNTINKINNEKDLTYLNDANVYQLMDYFSEYLSKSNNSK